MVDRIGGYNYRIGGPRPQRVTTDVTKGRTQQAQGHRSFAEVLDKQLRTDAKEVKFSSQATARLKARNLQLSASQVEALNRAVDKAAAKGSRDSLVLMDDMALVVSVKNRTVITVMDQEGMQENVFTNIDSAVLMKTSVDR